MTYTQRVLQILLLACLTGLVVSEDDYIGVRYSMRIRSEFWESLESDNNE